MRKRTWLLWSLCAALALGTSERARAFGGLWSSQGAPLTQSADRVLFVVNPEGTISAIVEIEFEGEPEKFAWLIPVPGTPAIAVSSRTVFERLDAATAPAYWLERTFADSCVIDAGAPDAAVETVGPGDIPTIDPTPSAAMLDRGAIGPYDYVTLSVDAGASDPAKVATDWLSANGYDLTDVDHDALAPYLSAGMNVVAIKLARGKDLRALRPVVLTYPGRKPLIPIRATRVAARDDMPIQIWVIGPSQAVPDNYASLVLNDARIDWLSAMEFKAGTLPSGGAGPFGMYYGEPANYDAVVSTAANEASGRGFVTELGAPASQFRDKVWAALDDDAFKTISTQTYADGIDALLNARTNYGAWDGFREAVEGAATLPAGVTVDAFIQNPDQFRGTATLDAPKFFGLLEAQAIEPLAAAGAMLYDGPYLTRLYTTLSANEMTLDPELDFNGDLAQVTTVHIAKRVFECSGDGEPESSPWRVEMPQGGVVRGQGSGWPVTASMPAALKIVDLSTSGSGTVVKDNTEAVRSAIGTYETAVSPETGVLIGETQSVTPPPSAAADAGYAPAPRKDSGCSVSNARGGVDAGLGCWLGIAGVWLMRRRRAWAAFAFLALAACSGDDAAPARAPADGMDAGEPLPPGSLTREQLRDPESCKGCHPIHYREWSTSMHAYSARDPVFIAMNERGQRETNGALGDFCVKCHAPMAVADKRTKDGLDLADMPEQKHGVSCYFCHNVASIEGNHNAMLRLGKDATLSGPIKDPIAPGVHGAVHSEIFEEQNAKSSAFCGGCHDIVTPSGVQLERTFEEYRNGLFSRSANGNGPAFESCMSCHMPSRQAQAAALPSAPVRLVHEHLWPGVDVPLIDAPNSQAMRSAVEDCQLGTASVSFFKLEVTPPNLFTFQIETNAGHNQPSGASQDRRMWLEFLAYDDSGALIKDASSGNIADGEIEEKPEGDPAHDPHLLIFRDRIFDAKGKQVHMFWEAERSEKYPQGFQSSALPVSASTYIEGKHIVLKQYRAAGPDGKMPARITARLRMRAIGLDVLQSLVESGDLDPAIAAKMPTLTFGAQIEWTPADGLMKTIMPKLNSDCGTYRCMLDPDATQCQGGQL